MAFHHHGNHLFLLTTLLIIISTTPLSLLATPTPTKSVVNQLESALTALRIHGYTLFANAISVSDLTFDILLMLTSSSGGVTLLAPPNSAVFNLDMASPSSFSYLNSLRHHMVPRRLSSHHLRLLSLSSRPFLATLIPHHFLHVTLSRDVILIDGVRLSSPDIFLRSGLSVHGLDRVIPSSVVGHHGHNGGFFDGLSEVQFPPAYPAGGPLSSSEEYTLSPAGFSPEPSSYGSWKEDKEEYVLSPTGQEWEEDEKEVPRKQYKNHVVEEEQEEEDEVEEGQNGQVPMSFEEISADPFHL